MLRKYIFEQMRAHPEKQMYENGTVFRFQEAADFAETFAAQLKGPCCAILCRSELSAALALLSCFAAGVPAVQLSFRYGEIHCKRILEMLKPPYMITDNAGRLQVKALEGGTYVNPPAGSPALIMCTSGTTGVPKGAMLSAENIYANLRGIEAYFPMGTKDRILILRPLYHCAVLTGEFLAALAAGTDICFYSGPFHPSEALRLIRTEQSTVLCATPTMLQLISRYAKARPPESLRYLVLSGECLAADAAEQIRRTFPEADIYHVYGLTEASPRVAYLPPEQFSRAPGCVGRPLNGITVKVTDAAGNTLPLGREGELWIKGPSVMMGYYNAPRQTADALKDGWLRTHDLAYLDEDGLIHIKCRMDDLIIRAGMNIYPQEIEHALRGDSRVAEALAYGIPDPFGGRKIGLLVKGTFADTAEVMALCREVLPSYEWPSRIALTDEIPKNGSGKMIRRK